MMGYCEGGISSDNELRTRINMEMLNKVKSV